MTRSPVLRRRRPRRRTGATVGAAPPGASPGDPPGSTAEVPVERSPGPPSDSASEAAGAGGWSVASPRPSGPGRPAGAGPASDPDIGSRRAWPMSLPFPAAVPRGGRRAMTTDGTSAPHGDNVAHVAPTGVATTHGVGVSPPGVRARARPPRRVAPGAPGGRPRRDRRALRQRSPLGTPRRGPGERCRPCERGRST